MSIETFDQKYLLFRLIKSTFYYRNIFLVISFFINIILNKFLYFIQKERRWQNCLAKFFTHFFKILSYFFLYVKCLKIKGKNSHGVLSRYKAFFLRYFAVFFQVSKKRFKESLGPVSRQILILFHWTNFQLMNGYL